MTYTAAVRTPKGAWQHRSQGSTAREAKRRLAKAAGLPLRSVDSLPLGRSQVASPGGWGEVEVRQGKGRGGARP